MVDMATLALLLLLFAALITASTAQKAHALNAEVPAFWPPWESSPRIGDKATYNSLDEGLRRMIEFRWTKAIYDAVLDRESRKCIKSFCFQVIPVYFWPGQRIDLRCLMSRRAFVSNGQVKKWRVLHHADMMDVFQEAKLYSLKWKTLGQVMNASRVENDYLPTTDPKFQYERVQPRFFQRDGSLIIMQASPGIQGIYNCYDDQRLDNRDLMYVVMAMTPYIHLKKGDQGVNNTYGRCPEMMNSERPVYAMPDLNWQWTFLPSLYWDRASPEEDAFLPRPRARTDMIHHQMKIAAHSDKDIDIHLNLVVGFAWSVWSPCTACAPNRGRRSREGHCYLKKAIPRQRITAYTHAKMRSEHVWLLQLDKLLDTPPFDRDGIRIHSSMLVTLASDEKWRHKFTACDPDRFSYAENFWNALFEVFNVLGRQNDSSGRMLHAIEEHYRMCVDGYFVEKSGIFSQWKDNSQSYYVTGYFFDIDECSDACN